MITTLGVYTQLLNLHDVNHQVISKNINNVNTPGYESVAVSNSAFSEILTAENKKHLPLNVTSANHIKGIDGSSGDVHITHRTEGVEEKINGNNVLLSYESIQLGQNSAKRSEALATYKALNGTITSAIGK